MNHILFWTAEKVTMKCAVDDCPRAAALNVPSRNERMCRECFFAHVEDAVHRTITAHTLFKRGEKVGICVSGGKDSTVLAHIISLLNRKHSYGLDLNLLAIDEGIVGYRDDSLATVKRNAIEYKLPLLVVSYQDLYGWSMDRIVALAGQSNCTFCGVFRRQALDRGAKLLGVDHLVTGHNADDVAETVLMNLMRGDSGRLQRCTQIQTRMPGGVRRSKPFKYTYEKEIVMYAYFKKLDYFSTECTYSPEAFRGHARVFLKDLEAVNPAAIIDIIHSGEAYQTDVVVGEAPVGVCERCGYMASQPVCKACILLEGLNRGLPRLGIGNTRRIRRDNPLLDDAAVGGTIQRFDELTVGGAIQTPLQKISLEF